MYAGQQMLELGWSRQEFLLGSGAGLAPRAEGQ